MRQEGALSRSESRLVRQEKAFAEGTRAAGGCVCRIARVQGRATAGPARAGFSLYETAFDVDVDLKDFDLNSRLPRLLSPRRYPTMKP